MRKGRGWSSSLPPLWVCWWVGLFATGGLASGVDRGFYGAPPERLLDLWGGWGVGVGEVGGGKGGGVALKV